MHPRNAVRPAFLLALVLSLAAGSLFAAQRRPMVEKLVRRIHNPVTTQAVTPNSTPCSLAISVQCANGQCTSVTTNSGSTACSGGYIVGFIAEVPPTQMSMTGIDSGLGFTECFDSSFFQDSDVTGALCIGETSVGPGSSFTTRATVTGTADVIGLTYVFDPMATEDSEPLAFVYASANSVQATCTPQHAEVDPQTMSGVPYYVRWSAVSEAGATYIVEESTKDDFSAITDTKTTTALQAQFQHTVTADTYYYYRVRATSCGGQPGQNSNTAAIVVNKPPETDLRGTDVVVPFGTTTPFGFPMTITFEGQGGYTFTATTDRPQFYSVSPASGTVPQSGVVQFTITASPGSLPPGANTGTLIVTTTPPAGKATTLAGTTVSVPVSVSLVTPVTPGGKSLPPSNALIIPVVTHVNASGTSSFVSDVRLTNASSAAMKYQVTFTPAGTDGTKNGKITNLTVNSLQTIALNDIANDFFGYGATGAITDQGFGALEIKPLGTSLTSTVASSRTYFKTPTGTYGQFIAAIPFSQFASALNTVPLPGTATPPPPAPMSLQQISGDSGKFRTNLGLVEGSGTPASGTINVYDDNGTKVATVPYSLQPGEQKQLGRFLSQNAGIANLTDGRIEITVDSATGAVSAYASVLDNKTTDPLAVQPVQPSLVKSTRYVLPGVADFGSPFSNFHSDVRIFNGGTASADVTLTFYPQAGGTPVALAPITIGAGQIKAYDNVLPVLFNVAQTGGAIVATTPATSSLVLTGRTYSIDAATGGTYGQFIPGVTPTSGSIGVGDPAQQVLQLEESAQFRSNVGLVETTGNPATVRITLTLPDSIVSANVDVPLAANEFRQLGKIISQNFGVAAAAYNARVTVQVTGGTGRVAAYGSVIDNATSDPTYVPAQ